MKKLAFSLQEEKGFTLIEMMVVVLVLAILAAFAAPSFRTMIANQRVTSAAQELQVLLLFARAEAVYKRTESTVTPTGLKWEAKVKDQVLRESTLSDAVNAEPGSSGGVVFEISGQARPASGGTSYAVSVSATNASRVQCLSVSPAGLVRLQGVPVGQACS
jgi:type II secretion system protein H